MLNNKPKFSVLMSVYKNDKPEWFEEAVESVINQTYKPDEIVLIRDGDVPVELDNKINELTEKHPLIKLHINEVNLGLGLTLQKGVNLCKHDLIARMDSDDISLNDRFETQIRFLQENPECDIVGGLIEEFDSATLKATSRRIVPTSHSDILKVSKTKTPMNHVTVMFRKDKVLESGNYQDLRYVEDYYLWVRMLKNNCRFANINKILVNVRIDYNTFMRKKGFKYYKAQKKLMKYMRKNKMIGFWRYAKNNIIRFVSSVLLPNKIRRFLFMKYMRNK